MGLLRREPEMVKYQLGAATRVIDRLRANSDPRQLYRQCRDFWALVLLTDADHGIEWDQSRTSPMQS